MVLPGLVVGVVPVVLFLLALVLLDSYKLVTRRAVARSIVWGMAAAGIAYALNAALLGPAGIEPATVRRYLAPLIEETLKASLLVSLIRRRKVAFLVDAGIHGFAAGTGFAVVENAYYAGAGTSGIAVWVVRGLGTALMHGSTTAIVGILAQGLTERHASRSLRWFVPGLLLATSIHSLFNHILLNPLVSTAILALTLPLLVAFVFERSERATEAWLGAGLDRDVELLEQIESGAIRSTHAGSYLESLRHSFPGPVVGDMLCYLQIHLELALRAKGLLLARAAGIALPVDPVVRANFAEMRFLEGSIGATGKLALMPLLRGSDRDIWQLAMLAEHGERNRRARGSASRTS